MRIKVLFTTLLVLLLAGSIGWLVYERLSELQAASIKADKKRGARAVPVEVAEVTQGTIALRRNFSGTLEANAEFVVSSKVSGHLVQLVVALGDRVVRNQVVAQVDNAEPLQNVARAEADVAVAEANLAEAQSLLVIAERELERIDKLRDRGVSSGSQQDEAKAVQLARQSHLQVTRAQVARVQADLASARLQLADTQVRAVWRAGSDSRMVAERLVNEGEMVSASDPLLRIVELDPITAVFYVTERDYALLHIQQRVELTTDAYSGETFRGAIARIAPVFNENSRQARVEVTIHNPELRLKPGMYSRAQVVLQTVAESTIVPEQALTSRDGEQGVFVVDGDAAHVSWQPVVAGIRDAGRVQLLGQGGGVKGRVVTLGQQLLNHGAAITIASEGRSE